MNCPSLGIIIRLLHFLTLVRAILLHFWHTWGMQKVVVASSYVSSHAAKWRSEDLDMKVLVFDEDAR
jgi:hypothetical protein